MSDMCNPDINFCPTIIFQREETDIIRENGVCSQQGLTSLFILVEMQLFAATEANRLK